MSGPELGRLVGSLTGMVGLFALSSAAADDFLPLLYFLGIIGFALLVISLIVGGAWMGEKAHAFLTGRYFDMAFGKMAAHSSRTEILPIPQDPFAENSRV